MAESEKPAVYDWKAVSGSSGRPSGRFSKAMHSGNLIELGRRDSDSQALECLTHMGRGQPSTETPAFQIKPGERWCTHTPTHS